MFGSYSVAEPTRNFKSGNTTYTTQQVTASEALKFALDATTLPTTLSTFWDIVPTICENGGRIGQYCIYRSQRDPSDIVVSPKGIFRHKPVSVERPESDYILISTWIQDGDPNPYTVRQVKSWSSAEPFQGVYTALFVYHNGNVAAYSFSGNRNIFVEYFLKSLEVTQTQPNPAVIISTNADSPLAILRKDTKNFISSGKGRSVKWNPLSLFAPGTLTFSGSGIVGAENGYLTRRYDHTGELSTAGAASELISLPVVDSYRIIKEHIFAKATANANEAERSYIVLPLHSGGKEYSVVATYNDIFLHAERGHRVMTALIDNPEASLSLSLSLPVQQPGMQQQQQQQQPVQPRVSPAFVPRIVASNPVASTSSSTVGAFPVTSGSCDNVNEDCYTWTLGDWEVADSNSQQLPDFNAEARFTVSVRAITEGHTVRSQQTTLSLSFVRNVTNTATTHVTIRSGNYAYDLVAIRPGSESQTPAICIAVLKSQNPNAYTASFVLCKLQIVNTRKPEDPGIYAEWAVPHIDTGHYFVSTNAATNLILFTQRVSMDRVGASDVPRSVVASYAKSSIYTADKILERVDGASRYKTLDLFVVAANTGNNNELGGVVGKTDLEGRMWLQHVNQQTANYDGIERINKVYFDDQLYKTNPHFRFTPPWFEGSRTPTILCIGDSLTDDKFMSPGCDPYNTGLSVPSYSKVLQEYLGHVGINATIDNIGYAGSKIWRGSVTSLYHWSLAYGPPPARSTLNASHHTLAIIWLGTNDLWDLNSALTEKKKDPTILKQELKSDFVRVMQTYKASHYLLVKVDGTRGPAGSHGCGNTGGTINLATCGVLDFKKEVEIVNETLEELEKEYSNVHVTGIDYSIERCPSGEPLTQNANGLGGFNGYLHFNRKEGIARSIFGRIMCHAIFHRETGDLRWVGAVPATKPGASLQRVVR